MKTTITLLLAALLCGVASAETAKVSQLTIGVPRISAPESKLKIIGYECATNTIRYSRHAGWETNYLLMTTSNDLNNVTVVTNFSSVRATTNMPAAVVHSVTFGKDGVPLFVLKAQIAMPINTDGGNWKNDEWRDLYSGVWAEHPPVATNVITVQAMNVTNVFGVLTTTTAYITNTHPRSHWQKYSTNGIVDKTVEEVVNELVQSGEFCRVRGHDWQMGCNYGAGCLAIHNKPTRHCPTCGREETQEVGPWK